MQTPTISEINDIIRASEEADSKVHAEQRSNILLYSGEHYAKRVDDFIRGRGEVPNKESRIRLTKNHIRRIINHYINTITSSAPSAVAQPCNESEISDVKAADLNTSVINYCRKKYDLPRKHMYQAQDFFIQGEVIAKITWNPNKGRVLGYAQKTDEMGNPTFDEWGRPEPSDDPVFSGDLDIERIWSWNLIRDRHADSLDEAKVLGYKKLVDQKELLEEYEEDEEKTKFIKEAAGDTMRIFDPGNGAYSDSKGQVLVTYLFWRPCKKYPEGWWTLSTRAGILSEGTLPFGLFPLVAESCIDQPSSPRGRSPIKDLRPFQVEINRASSKRAENQLANGDDKIVLPNGSNLTQGAVMPGIRTFKATGSAPIIIEGRSGDQYLSTIESEIQEMYEVAMVKELLEDRTDNQQDPYSMIFKSLRQKKGFSLYADKFERFVLRFYELMLETLRVYMPADEIIPMVGRDEIINLDEFKNSSPLSYQIKLESLSEDAETLMSKQMAFSQMLQYVGQNLTRNDIGKIVTQMPFLPEGKRIFSDLVIDEENANNIILQLDRGKFPILKPGLNKEYTLTRLTARQNKADYEFINPQFRMNYDMFIMQIQDALTQELQAKKALESEYIPAQGFLTPCDFYVPDPTKPGVTRRARLPIDSLGWLVKRLEEQGNTLQRMEQMQSSTQGQLAQHALGVIQGASAQQQIGQMGPQLTGGVENGNATASSANPGDAGISVSQFSGQL